MTSGRSPPGGVDHTVLGHPKNMPVAPARGEDIHRVVVSEPSYHTHVLLALRLSDSEMTAIIKPVHTTCEGKCIEQIQIVTRKGVLLSNNSCQNDVMLL